ncbi:hypothetical protein VP01_907g5 [Puccinia sorghi]|uniref:DDE Tnp4 domain-containing protein n=1 Tax=Puccinia sorghi TaxID=27349 RepID=A0A0L6U8A0_9BASI|nr:hypothetical protein VP01_907g5 [Puccinia sorghi]
MRTKFEVLIQFVEGATTPCYEYLVNCQVICDCDKFITSFLTGWPGSCWDSLVYKKMSMYTKPSNHFYPGN